MSKLYTHNLRTARIAAIAEHMVDLGMYTQADTVEQLAQQRDELAHALHALAYGDDCVGHHYDGTPEVKQALEALAKVQR